MRRFWRIPKFFSVTFLAATVVLTSGLGVTSVRADFEAGQKAFQDGKFAIVLKEWESAAAAGDVRAQYGLAKLYLDGGNVSRNIVAAKNWLTRAAQGGHAEAQVQLGRLLASRRGSSDWPQAVSWWKKAEAQGEPTAHYYLGIALFDGKGVKRDVGQAMTHLRIAAGLGVAQAQNRLGAHYSKGVAVPRNPAIAVAFWRSAAASGNLAAEYNLGNAYRNGQGVEQDYAKAEKLLSDAVAKGHVRAMYLLGLMHKEGTGVEKNFDRALVLFERAARKGLKYAQFELGLAYQSAHGVRKDNSIAKHWFQLAAKQGLEKAIDQLAVIVEEEAEARMLAELDAIEALRQKQTAVEEAKRRKAAADLPEAGPAVSYKGRKLIGSVYPDARNEDFFSIVKKAIDMSGELPEELQHYIKLIDTIIYDPPSKRRKAKGIQTDIVGVYTIVDADRKGPVVIYKDVTFSSPLEISMSLLGNGTLASRHLRVLHLAKMLAESKAGKRNLAPAERQEIVAELNARAAVINKTDRTLMNKGECESQLLMLKADKAYGISQQKISARMRLLNQRKCW